MFVNKADSFKVSWIRFLAKSDPGLCTSEPLSWKNHSPDPGLYSLLRTSDTKNMDNKKEVFQSYLKYVYNSIFNVILRSRYRALDPNLANKRIHNTAPGI